MKKNVSGQIVGAQMISATDGSAFTSAVTCFVTGDGGSQAQGSVGSGACTHEGNGFHTYAPSQAETNFDHVAFTFTGTGAIPVTVQIYTTFPQTGDSFARLGAPAGASVSADIAAIESQTDDIGVAGAGLNAIPWNSAWDAEVQSEVADALAAYDPPTKAELDSGLAGLNDLDAAGVRTAVGLASANLDTQLAALPTAAENRAEMDSNSTQLAAIVEDTGTTIPATLAALATASALATVDNNVDAIKAKTDSLTFTQAGEVDANVQSINDVAITGDGSDTPFDVT